MDAATRELVNLLTATEAIRDDPRAVRRAAHGWQQDALAHVD